MKYIIFDIDGTLTNTTSVDDKCYISAFESLFNTSIHDVNWADLKNVTDWGITEELVRNKLKREVNIEELKQLKEIFVNDLKNELIVDKSQFSEIAGAKSFFNNLINNEQYEVGIATGGWEESANLKLKAIGINPYKTSYSNSNHFKKREDITLAVIEQLKLKTNHSASEIIYFGDGEWDYTTCQKLQIRFIGIDSLRNNKLKKMGAKEIYSDFTDSRKIIKSL